MKISVIMSVYNCEKYLRESIESICNQDYKNFEFLIVNDASTDNSEKIILEIAEKDNRIRYIKNEKNIGLTKSLNKLISMASGELIARMDADDIAVNNRFSQQVRIFRENLEIECVFTNAVIIDKDSKYVCNSWIPNNCEKVIKLMPYFNYIIHPTVMFKKTLVNKIGGYNEKFIKGQDKELWERFIKNNVKFYYLNSKLLRYRINPNSVRSINGENYSYKLAKNCINNNSKSVAMKYMKNLSAIEKIDIGMRCIIPFYLYRKSIYLKNLFKEIKK